MQTKEQRLFFVILLPPKHTTYGDKLISFGGETISYDAYGSLAYRFNHVDFESEQTFQTYLFRFIGNLAIRGRK